MKGRYRKTCHGSRRLKWVYRAEVVQAGSDGQDRSVRVDLPIGELLGDLRPAVDDFAGEAGLKLMLTLIAEEVEQRAGRRYEHNGQRSWAIPPVAADPRHRLLWLVVRDTGCRGLGPGKNPEGWTVWQSKRVTAGVVRPAGLIVRFSSAVPGFGHDRNAKTADLL